MISMGDVFAQGIIGGVAGGAQAAATSALEEQKAQMEAVREQRLSSLRQQDHVAARTADVRIAKEDSDRKAAENAQFYARTGPNSPGAPKGPGIIDQARGTYDTDAGPQTTESNVAATATPPSRAQMAKFQLDEAKKTGKPDLIKQGYEEEKDVRADADQTRRTDAAVATAGHQQRQDAAREDANRIRDKQVDAMIQNMAGKNGKVPAKVQEVNWLAEHVFDGDTKKAVQYAYGTSDKDRAGRVIQVAKLIKDSPEMGNATNAQLMDKASSIVDGFEAIGPTRGGVSANPGGSTRPASGAAPKTAIPQGSMDSPMRPANVAELKKLPKGSYYIDPASGTTLVKTKD